MSSESAHLTDNIRHLREVRGLSQAQIAQLAGIPRATWTHLESGAANPTLNVLVKVANALQVRLEELLSPARSPVLQVKVANLASRRRGEVTVRKVLPETIAGLDLERMTFPPRARMVGVPHTDGTREYLTCEKGAVELTVAGAVWRLGAGDVVAFRGNQKHQYFNPTDGEAIAYSVLAFAPIAS
jgi:transcriptional regulator with XRE-family HTH domain